MRGGIRAVGYVAALAVFIGGAFSALADDSAPVQQVTFAKDILPIFQQKCQTCHRSGGDNYTGMVAPMPLIKYEEVRPYAKSIAKKVADREMPPWKASTEFHGVFKNDRSLNEGEIAMIQKWVASGAREGNPADAPAPVAFPAFSGWRIGNPDLIVKFDKPYHVSDEVNNEYANVTVTLTPEMLPESRWVKAIEWKGGSKVVHHIVGFASAPADGKGMPAMYGLGSIAPGEEPMIFPDGYAKLLVKGSKLIFSMHYHKDPGAGTGVEDISSVAFKFYPVGAKIEHFVDHGAIGHHAFELPPGNPNWKVGAARTFTEDTTILTLHPHMHLRGKDAKYIAFYPDGKTETLLNVPQWDFNWQTDYSFKEPKKIPAGTRIEYTAHFDNSPGNPANPDPKIPITWGGRTEDEMMLGYVTSADTKAKEVTIEAAMASMRTELGRR